MRRSLLPAASKSGPRIEPLNDTNQDADDGDNLYSDDGDRGRQHRGDEATTLDAIWWTSNTTAPPCRQYYHGYVNLMCVFYQLLLSHVADDLLSAPINVSLGNARYKFTMEPVFFSLPTRNIILGYSTRCPESTGVHPEI
jgi:hypothetical protein